MPKPFALKSTRVVTPTGELAAAIVIEDGKIARVGGGEISADIEVVDFGDLLISPGVVDTHVHINDPGTDWEGFASATAAAAAGGVTTLIDMPLNSIPVTTSEEGLQVKRAAAQGKCHVDVGFYGGVVPGNEKQLGDLLARNVFGLKAFLCDSGLDEFPAAGEAELRSALAVLKPCGVPLLAHAEIVTAQGGIGFQPVSERDLRLEAYATFARTRPPEYEIEAIKLLIALCREYRTPIHIVHLATAEALPLIESAKDEGLPLTVETCPHYLYFSEDEIADGDTRFKCAPPIRDRANRDALRDAVASGLVDTIGSDHSPCPPELKRMDEGDFEEAWGGIAGLQLTLAVIWTVGKAQNWKPQRLAQRLSTRPAEIFGLGQTKGQIAIGFDADLVVWDPDASFEVKAESLLHRHKVSPYVGRTLKGVVRRTYLRGECVFDSNELPQPLHFRGQRLRADQRIAGILNSVSLEEKAAALETCCASRAWVESMMGVGEFASDIQIFATADRSATSLTESDWLEAFTAHPRIGDVDSLREKFANTKQMASGEQSGVAAADDKILNHLAQGNDEYFEKFGFIFIVFATGKSAAEMLGLLEQRLGNDRETEIANAAAEQLKITKLRLRKLAL